MRAETQNIVDAIRKSLKLLGQRMDLETAPHRLEEFNAMIEDGDLWSDPARAQKLMRDRQALSDAVEGYRRIDSDLTAEEHALFERLRAWRAATAKEHGVPAYVILHDKTLRELAEVRPTSRGLLATISGLGSAKIEHYGEELLSLIRSA